jgi:hypothetical protein
VSPRLNQQLTFCAACSAVQVIAVVAAALGVVAVEAALAVAVVAAVPVLWGWGRFQAAIAMNPELDVAEQARWRMLLACVPGAMALYWHRHVRGAY